MADKKPWIGQDTFPTIWIWICVFFNTVGILAMVMLIVAEIVIIANNMDNYIDQYGNSYPARHYFGEEGSGFVGWTNAPKHTGSAIWMIFYQIAIIIFVTLVIASDLAWRKASYNEYGGHYVQAFYATGIMEGAHNKGLFYYVVANAFLKLFVVVLYMSQSFYGLSGGSHDAPDFDRMATGGVVTVSPATTVFITTPAATAHHAGATVVTGPNGGSLQTRELLRRGPDPHDPRAAYGTELWAEWAGWIVLGSIVPSIIAFMFLVPWAAKKNDEGKPADAEKAKKERPKPKSKEGKPKEGK